MLISLTLKPASAGRRVYINPVSLISTESHGDETVALLHGNIRHVVCETPDEISALAAKAMRRCRVPA